MDITQYEIKASYIMLYKVVDTSFSLNNNHNERR